VAPLAAPGASRLHAAPAETLAQGRRIDQLGPCRQGGLSALRLAEPSGCAPPGISDPQPPDPYDSGPRLGRLWRCCSRRSQVIPEGAGAVKSSWRGFLVVLARHGGVGTRRVKAAAVAMRGRGPPAKWSEALTPTPCGARCPAARGRTSEVWVPGVLGVVVVSVSKAGVPAGADPHGGCQSSLRRARHGAVRHQRSVGVNQMGRPRHRRWGS